MENHIRVVVADDHPVIRMGVEAAIDSITQLRRVGSAADSTQLVALLSANPCDVLVTDYAMPGGAYGDGLVLLTFLQSKFPSLRIIVMTAIDKPVLIRSLLGCGIDTILSKADDLSHLRAAIQAAHIGRRYFSPSIANVIKQMPTLAGPARLSQRETEVIAMYVGGTTINAIAEKLQRSKQTISTQKVSAMRKLGIETDADLFKYAIELGLTRAPSEPQS